MPEFSDFFNNTTYAFQYSLGGRDGRLVTEDFETGFHVVLLYAPQPIESWVQNTDNIHLGAQIARLTIREPDDPDESGNVWGNIQGISGIFTRIPERQEIFKGQTMHFFQYEADETKAGFILTGNGQSMSVLKVFDDKDELALAEGAYGLYSVQLPPSTNGLSRQDIAAAKRLYGQSIGTFFAHNDMRQFANPALRLTN